MNTKQPKQRLRSKRLVEACITTQSCYRMYKATCEKERRLRMYNEKKHIAERLLISEKDYFKDLNLLLSNFLDPLTADQVAVDILSKYQDLSTNIHNLSEVLRSMITFHKELLKMLEDKVVAHWNIQMRFGDFFSLICSHLKAYLKYLIHYQPIINAVQKSCDSDGELEKLLNDYISRECDSRGLVDIIGRPIQRITDYNQYIHELKNQTWETHCDYDQLSDNAIDISAISKNMNSGKQNYLKLTKKLELAKRIQIPSTWKFRIMDAHQNYIWEENVEISIIDLNDGSSVILKNPILFVLTGVIFACETLKNILKPNSFILLDEIEDIVKTSNNTCSIISLQLEWRFTLNEKTTEDFITNLIQFYAKESERKTVVIKQNNLENQSESPNSRKLKRALSVKALKNSLTPKPKEKQSSIEINIPVEPKDIFEEKKEEEEEQEQLISDFSQTRKDGSMGFISFMNG